MIELVCVSKPENFGRICVADQVGKPTVKAGGDTTTNVTNLFLITRSSLRNNVKAPNIGTRKRKKKEKCQHYKLMSNSFFRGGRRENIIIIIIISLPHEKIAPFCPILVVDLHFFVRCAATADA